MVLTNGVVAGTNQAGQFLDLTIDGPVEFQGSQPIQVAQFANSAIFDSDGIGEADTNGDPCEILLPPTGHSLETNIVATGPAYLPPAVDTFGDSYANAGGFTKNYLNLIVPPPAITNTFLDNSPVAATNFVPIGMSGYYGARLSVTNGTHKIISSQPVGVEIYGWGENDAYGYFGGWVR